MASRATVSITCSLVNGNRITRCAHKAAKVPVEHPRPIRMNRRSLLGAPLVLSSILLGQERTEAVELVPLGDVVAIGGPKKTGLSAEQVMDILEADFRERRYFVTGNLSPEIFSDDCRFRDPTNDTTGLSKYVKALKILFDPDNSKVTLKSIKVIDSKTIDAEWILEGFLKFPWHPNIPPVEGTARYTLNDAGLIQFQDEAWGTPSWKVLADTVTPHRAPQLKA